MPPEHLSIGDLQEYVFDRASESKLALIEEHLLLCESCRRLCSAIDEQARGPLNRLDTTDTLGQARNRKVILFSRTKRLPETSR